MAAGLGEMLASRKVIFFIFLSCLASEVAYCQTTKESPVLYCRDAFSSKDYSQSNASIAGGNQDLSSEIMYHGKHESCILDKNSSFRIELDRLTRVSDVGIRLTHQMEDVTAKLQLTALRDVRSDRRSSVRFNCSFSSKEGDFAHYKCKKQDGSYHAAGVLVNAIEISTTQENPLNLNLNVTSNSSWMSVVQKSRDNHSEYEEQCLRPGHYFTQLLNEQSTSFELDSVVKYCCNVQRPCTDQRKCTSNGWDASPPRCLPEDLSSLSTTEEKTQDFLITGNNEAVSHYLDKDYSVITSIQVTLQNWNCSLYRSKTYPYFKSYDNIYDAISFEVVGLNGSNVTWIVTSAASNYLHQREGCQVTYEPRYSGARPGLYSFNSTDCTIKLKFRKQMPEPFSGQVTVSAVRRTDNETYEWMKNGCPPIDPYVGMPDEYANEASKDPVSLNKKLRESPCRDGYRAVNYDVNKPRRCEGNSWTGDIPKCKLITCKTPPQIHHGHWRYVGDSVYHLAQYTCDEPIFLDTGEGIAKCNDELNEWEGVPVCKREPTHEMVPNITEAIATDVHSPTMVDATELATEPTRSSQEKTVLIATVDDTESETEITRSSQETTVSIPTVDDTESATEVTRSSQQTTVLIATVDDTELATKLNGSSQERTVLIAVVVSLLILLVGLSCLFVHRQKMRKSEASKLPSKVPRATQIANLKGLNVNNADPRKFLSTSFPENSPYAKYYDENDLTSLKATSGLSSGNREFKCFSADRDIYDENLYLNLRPAAGNQRVHHDYSDATSSGFTEKQNIAFDFAGISSNQDALLDTFGNKPVQDLQKVATIKPIYSSFNSNVSPSQHPTLQP